MADANFRSGTVRVRSLRLDDLVFGADPTETDFAVAARADTCRELIAKTFANPPSTLTSSQRQALRTLLEVLTQSEVDTRADIRAAARFTDAEQTKLAGIASGATAVTDASINALIAAALSGAVMGNTETGIDVTYASGKLNFVVSAWGCANAAYTIRRDALCGQLVRPCGPFRHRGYYIRDRRIDAAYMVVWYAVFCYLPGDGGG